ncbi:hypothetical protein [Longimicrobium sp.]|uniref:hypothetical protein n=1 Tax=Longimicrobium sp. TaxID=2029185 RepID=UPI002E36BDE4|nr:hypothetical protein [Longimicrobium sp.]HEX6038866.1 hypothetical protein [Longimicrobium sp.]
MAGTPMPYVLQQWFTNAGAPLNGGLLFVYLAGTSTKTDSYTTAALSTPNANPVVMNSAGRPTSGGIFLAPGVNYKFVMALSTDTDPPASPIWTVDNVQAVPAAASDVDVEVTFGTTVAAEEWVYLSAGDGGNTTGRWYLTDADLSYASVSAPMLGIALTGGDAGDTGTVRVVGRMTGLSGLVAGTVYYLSATAGAVTSTAPTSTGNVRRVLMADGTTSGLILDQSWASDVQTFAASGTYYKPNTATFVRVVAYGAGGGGGGGAGGEAAGQVAQEGAGGGGGARVERTFLASDISASVAVTIGAGGDGGAGGAGGSPSNGTIGSAGGNTTFGAYLTAFGGGGGAPGLATPAASGGGGGGGGGAVGGNGASGVNTVGGGPGSDSLGGDATSDSGGGGSATSSNGGGGFNGGGGGGANESAGNVTIAGGTSLFGGGGGGAGGGVAAANTNTNGGAGGDTGGDLTFGGTGGGGTGGTGGAAFNTNQNGAAGDSTKGGQGGGGGGGRRDGTTAAAGGAGGVPGGGGGGGGAGQASSTAGGAGGAGGAGACYVFSF